METKRDHDEVVRFDLSPQAVLQPLKRNKRGELPPSREKEMILL